MNYYSLTESAISKLILASTTIMGKAKCVKSGFQDLKSYAGKLPGIGVKCIDVDRSDDGKIVCRGVCEVVASGEFAAGMPSVEEIACMVLDLLNDYPSGWNGYIFSGSGIKEMTGQYDEHYVTLCHVNFTFEP